MNDYLDNPPKRYRCYGKDDFGHPYEALTAEAADGEWVRFADMDLYMFEGGQLMLQSAARIDVLEQALQVLLPGLILDLRYANDDDDKDAMRARIDTVQEALAACSPSPSKNLSIRSAPSDATVDREGEP